MAFLNNKKFQEIRQAGKDGNEKAKMVLQALRKGASQEDLDRLMNDYYNVGDEEPNFDDIDFDIEEEIFNEEPKMEEKPQTMPQQPQMEQPKLPEELKPEISEDISGILDKETEDLFDENEIKDTSFDDFLKTKRRDSNRAKKNADYFKAYDLGGRQHYMEDKINGYKKKFDGKLRDIDRKYADTNLSLDKYSQSANDMLDDDIELDISKAGQAYDEFTGSPEIMRSFGRHWDKKDSDDVVFALAELMKKYGKKNVIAALNTLRSDNDNYKKFLTNQIDTEIGRYSKSIENLLR